MKSIYSKLVLVSLLLVSFAGSVSARECIECRRTNAKKAVVKAKAAACKRAQSTAELNINNVRALINGYGNMWYDGSVAQYHLPKNSNTCPLFCAALWIGGTDVNDQIRIAALRFGSEGDDYWPGPLKINGTASIDLPVCNAYDKHWIITQSEVLALKEHFTYLDSSVVKNSDPKDDITDVILNWPARGEGDDLTSYLAPFYDADGDGVYNPYNGDYPYYDFDNKLCPRYIKANNPDQATVKIPSMEETHGGGITGSILSDQVLKGDQTIWWVFNDMGNTHTETGGQPIGLEIRAQAFAFSTNDRINDMTFYSYEIINRSTYELRETYFSQWVDPDLGYAKDDFVGCDVRRGLGYCYNGQSQDTPGSGSYSGIPPAVGIDFFQGPYMDPDGKDNPKIDIPKIQSLGSAPMKQLLASYEVKDENGAFMGYDTIQISYDADKFDHEYWYFVPGDAIGNCAINGVNFGNGIVDDERFGMRRFVYYDNSLSTVNGEPTKASDYYNYLRGYWKNGQRMKFGGNAISMNTTDIPCDFMFPGDSDPWNWGTDGVVPTGGNVADYGSEGWTELTAGNSPDDRRFMQSAGPFTLKPGALNYITVGIPFAQAANGDQWTSVTLLRQIDDVCQALFENCFKVLDGPDAPTLIAQELSNEIILYLTYENANSNNYGESYAELDPAITSYYIDEQGVTHTYDQDQLKYKFEGYQIYQLKDATASIADIDDPNKAVLVAQCDIENYYDTLLIEARQEISGSDTTIVYDTTVNPSPSLPIGTLINYTQNSETGILNGRVMVRGANKGIQHVFRITKDMFSTGTSTALVNNREYYFVAIAYAHNRYKEYLQTDAAFLDGQKEPYLAGRKNENGGSITPITVIPHSPVAEYGGSRAQAEFGMSPNIIRLGGYGNGGSMLRLTQASIDSLMGAPGQPAKAPGTMMGRVVPTTGVDLYKMTDPCIIANPMYEENYGPINVRVIDPLKIKEGRFNVLFWNEAYDSRNRLINDSTAGITATTRWCVVREDGGHFDSTLNDGRWIYTDTIWSDFAIGRYNEQLFLDLGLAITLVNPAPVATEGRLIMGNVYDYWGGLVNSGALLGSSMKFADSSAQWLSGIADNDDYMVYNWVRSGTQFSGTANVRFTSLGSKYDVNEAYLDEDYFRGLLSDPRYAPTTEAVDKNQVFENVVYGMWAPYGLSSTLPFHPAFNFSYYMADDETLSSLGINRNKLERQLMVNHFNKSLYFNNMAALPSVRIVLTPDTSKWTRCPVIEMCDDYTQSEGNARRFSARKHASVDKMGRFIGGTGEYAFEGTADNNDPSNPAYISDSGMGWFPGYAINTVTGERLNIMFGEDSRFVQYNGADMMWNPVSVDVEGQNYVMGGRHFVYVMNATKQPFYKMSTTESNDYTTFYYTTPSYDAGRWAMSMLNSVNRMMKLDIYSGKQVMKNGITLNVNNMLPTRDSIALLYASTAWVTMPLAAASRYEFTSPMDMPCDVTVDIDVRAPYGTFMSRNNTSSPAAGTAIKNREMPIYQFVMNASDAAITDIATGRNARQEYIDSILSLINVVPNPYYSYSEYETASQLETKVRIVNLPTGIENGKPQGCMIRIYTVDGTLVRTIGPTATTREVNKGHYAESTSVDWDLHNQTGIPIAGGMYLIHVSVPGIGERVIKWFGTMRPVDLNSFQF